MIGAQTDQAVQEHLIEKYMLLPNQVWDSIIQQATKVRQFSILTRQQIFKVGVGGRVYILKLPRKLLSNIALNSSLIKDLI